MHTRTNLAPALVNLGAAELIDISEGFAVNAHSCHDIVVKTQLHNIAVGENQAQWPTCARKEYDCNGCTCFGITASFISGLRQEIIYPKTLPLLDRAMPPVTYIFLSTMLSPKAAHDANHFCRLIKACNPLLLETSMSAAAVSKYTALTECPSIVSC